MENKTLFIVEGDSDEPKFIKQMFLKCYKKKEYRTYSYRANIHMLASELMKNYSDFDKDNIDIKLILKSLEKDKDRKKILDGNYNDIYLIFDFDPQHQILEFSFIKRMLIYFNDSTAQGKLFINYPMMQSYKHFSTLPDNTFESRTVEIKEIKNYKKEVNKTSSFTDLSKYNYCTFYSLAVHHLRKYNKLIYNEYNVLSVDKYISSDGSTVFDIETNNFLNSNPIDVLNTCIFTLIDFAPYNFFRFINLKSDELNI